MDLRPLLISVVLATSTGCAATAAGPPATNAGPAALSVKRFTSAEARAWMQYSGFSLADVVNEDETPGVKLGAVGFTRAPAGATSKFQFAYDEVIVVTRGRATVRSGGSSFTAAAGEVLYLPANVPGTFHADEALEIVYVASSPYGAVNRAAKSGLLKKSGSEAP